MRIDFDPAKDAANLAKHGVSLLLARGLDWDVALIWSDRRFGYDEERMVALAPKGDTLYYVGRTLIAEEAVALSACAE